jgi:hypothetical protein
MSKLNGSARKMDAIVDRVMKKVERNGSTTLIGARALCVAEVRKTGGPGALGIGEAFVYQALAHEFGKRINSRFRGSMPAQSFGVAMRSCPPELVQVLPRLHRWIALGEGPSAVWKPSRLASTEDWKTNHSLKTRKAQQTEAAAGISLQIAKFLSKYGYSSLSEILPE